MRLKLVKCELMDNWYTIERAEHEDRYWTERYENEWGGGTMLMYSGRISDACVEGTLHEMIALAEAIEWRNEVEFRRCAVDATQDPVKLWSPRNSEEPGAVPYADALDLARQIREEEARRRNQEEG